MKTTLVRLALLGAWMAWGSGAMAMPQHAHHGDHASSQSTPPAQPWHADAALREGMTRIHTALEELRHYEMGHMDATMALDRVGLIEQAAADIFTTCKLAPEQDAALHTMLVPLLHAASQLKQDPRDMAQMTAMRDAVAAYPRYFDQPRWAAAPHSH